MGQSSAPGHPLSSQIWHFILHLRWHYQLFILSGGFLLGGFLSNHMNWMTFLIQFTNVHLLLFGGATAYNSYWDKDKGPIGGLKNPPEMMRWMWFASLLLQMIGLLMALPSGSIYTAIYALSMLLFWLYSTPLVRWKGTPVKSLIAIGISTGTNSLLLGYLSAGNNTFPSSVLYASFGVALIILSLYPTSQIYQLDEDLKRGDRTFAIKFGFTGIFHFFEIAFGCGVLLVSIALLDEYFWLANTFFLIGLMVGIWVREQLKGLTAEQGDYYTIMKVKFITSAVFISLLVIGLVLKHSNVGIVLGVDAFFR